MKKFSFFAALFAIAVLSFAFTDKKRPRTSGGVGKLVYPVAGKKSTLKDLWGASRGGGRRKHKGIDIHARKGTPVVAITDGVISTRGVFPVGGKVLWLKAAGQPWTAYYAHLDKWAVKEGQYVRKGQVLGTVGNTGNARSTPPHLHFGIKNSQGWINPLPYVKRATKVAAPKVTTKKVSPRKTTKNKRSRR